MQINRWIHDIDDYDDDEQQHSIWMMISHVIFHLSIHIMIACPKLIGRSEIFSAHFLRIVRFSSFSFQWKLCVETFKYAQLLEVVVNIFIFRYS